MTYLEYTEQFTTDSSLVDDVYYNENDRTLSVDLNDEIYSYSDVPKSVFEDFRRAGSKGRFYGSEVKRKFGPGDHVGNYDTVEFERVPLDSPLLATLGTPKGLTLSANAVVNNTASSNTFFSLAGATVHTTPVTERQHKVVFTTAGGNTRREYTVKSTDVTGAVTALREVADALGVEFDVKEVTVYFE